MMSEPPQRSPCAVLDPSPSPQLRGTSCPSCQKPFHGNPALGAWLMCQESPQEMREVTLLLPRKKSTDHENCGCANSAAEERLFPLCVSISSKREANLQVLAKEKVFLWESTKKCSHMKPLELAGSTRVKPNVSVSEGCRAEGPSPTFPCLSL